MIEESTTKEAFIVDKIRNFKSRFDMVFLNGGTMKRNVEFAGLKEGDRILSNGMEFIYKGTQVVNRGNYKGEMFIFRNETHELIYPPIRFLENFYSGKVKLIKCLANN